MLDELDQDIREHIAQETQDNIDRGMPPKEARYAALRKFGNVTRVKEETREVWSFVWLEQLLQDIRFGLRMLRKNPSFTAVAILTLAVGIGANTAIFSAVNGILIEHLPYADSSRLLTIRREQLAYPIYFDEVREIQSQCTAFERMALFRGSFSLILGGAMPERRSVSSVSGDFFPMLGVQPLLGRPILPEDTQPGHPQVAVLSYRFWMDGFGGAPRIVGRDIVVEKDLYTVIGVMPKEFELGVDWLGEREEGLWLPLAPPTSDPRKRGREGDEIIARVKKGVTLSEAKAQLRSLSARFAETFPKNTRGVELVAQSPKLFILPDLRTGLLILLGAVAFVLLIASLNVSALLVARAWARQKELAIRRSLGASRLRIVRQLLSESVLLALAGGALGSFFSVWGIRILRAIAPPGTPRMDRLHLDSNVLWFTLGISLLAAILFGLLPALQASSRGVGGVLKGGLGGSFAGAATRQRHSLRSALVITEVGLAVVLVIGGALMARSFDKLMNVNTGVRADHVLTMRVYLSDLSCNDKDWRAKCPLATKSILDGINSLPGVERAALSFSGPLQGGEIITSFNYPGKAPGIGLYVDGEQGNQLSSEEIIGRPVTPGFFAALGIRILKGRDFVAADLTSGHRVAIVSEGFARKYLQGDPLGKRFSTHDDFKGRRVWMEVVGVVNDTHDRAVRETWDALTFYTPLPYGNNQWEIIARTFGDPTSLAKAIEGVVWSVDKDAPITHIETLDEIVSNSAAQPRFQTVLLGSFGALALLLAIIGIYGMISYSVVQRTHEIGVRMALGAQAGDVLRLVVKQGIALALVGAVAGLGVALGVTRYLTSMLYDVHADDPLTMIAVAVVLTLVALAACYIPARRAMRVDPMVALRYE